MIFVRNTNCKFPTEAREIERIVSGFGQTDINWIDTHKTGPLKLSTLRKLAGLIRADVLA